jgi:hypothetical protein
MHERDRVGFEKLHHPDDVGEHEDLEEKLRSAPSDPAGPSGSGSIWAVP